MPEQIASKPKIVTDLTMLQTELESAEPWPGYPEGTRAIVNRRVLWRKDYEELKCRGYLRIGQPAHAVTMLYDEMGSPLGTHVEPGDVLDSWSQWQKILSQRTEKPHV